MPEIILREPIETDALKFFDILNNDNFQFFTVRPGSVEEEKNWIKDARDKKKRGIAHHFSIIFRDELVGGAGIKIDQHRKFIGEIGYFIDEGYWGMGIATEAVSILEDIAWKELGLKRLQILVQPENLPSLRVAQKSGYRIEGFLKGAIDLRGNLVDAILFGKLRK